MAESMTVLKNLLSVAMESCSLTASSLVDITSSLVNAGNLTALDFSFNGELGGSAEKWADRVQILKHLKKLRLCDCRLVQEDVRHLSKAISCMNSLVECTVGGVIEAPGSEQGKFNVTPLGGGVMLAVTASNLTDIVESMSNRDDMTALLLTGVEVQSGSGASWANHIQKLTILERLTLEHCSLQSTDMKPIALSLKDTPNLVELQLSRNESLGGTAKSWASCLRFLSHLKKLACDRCALQSTDMEHIAGTLSDMPTLVELDLSGNPSLGGLAVEWGQSVKRMTHLSELDLRECSLTSEDREHLAKLRLELTAMGSTDLYCRLTAGVGV